MDAVELGAADRLRLPVAATPPLAAVNDALDRLRVAPQPRRCHAGWPSTSPEETG